jgi:hypothetical protein
VPWSGTPETFRSDEGTVVESVEDKLESLVVIDGLECEDIFFHKGVSAVFHKNFSNSGGGGALVAGTLVEHTHEPLVVKRPSGRECNVAREFNAAQSSKYGGRGAQPKSSPPKVHERIWLQRGQRVFRPAALRGKTCRLSRSQTFEHGLVHEILVITLVVAVFIKEPSRRIGNVGDVLNGRCAGNGF